MKLLIISLSVIAICIGFTGMSDAMLVDFNEDVVRDDRNTSNPTDDLFWFKNVRMFRGVTYSQQKSLIETLNFSHTGPRNNWQMASLDQMESLWSHSFEDIMSLFIRTGAGKYGTAYIAGRYEDSVILEGSAFPDHHYVAELGYTSDECGDEYKVPLGVNYVSDSHTSDPNVFGNYNVGVWAIAPVPIPATIYLLGAALIGIAGIRRKLKNQKHLMQ